MKDRLIACFSHFVISVIVLSFVYFLVRWIWYSGFMYQLDGAREGAKVVLIVDLVLGPALTFLVYKKAKKGLMLDLTLIGLLQISAMAYGVHLLYDYRPLVLLLTGNQFVSVTADIFDNYSKELPPQAGANSRQLCGFSCYILSDSAEVIQSVMVDGVSPRAVHQYYLDYASNWKQDIRSLNFNDNSQVADKDRSEIKEKLVSLASLKNLDQEQLVVLSARGRYVSGYVFVEKSNGKIHDFIVASGG